LRLGFGKYKDLGMLFCYMLPEIMIAILILNNEIFIKIQGLHYTIEEDMETLTDGIQRSLAGEDEDLEAKKQSDANMNMALYFIDSEK
jgi:hypothetical protein